MASAASSVGWINFAVASTLGKVPAILVEAYSVEQILIWSQGNVRMILGIVGIIIIVLIVIRHKKTYLTK